MKKIIAITAFAALSWMGAEAQSVYDAHNIASKDLNGTARFVGMGGAMGALGGDISTIGTNPAGIGIYRSNDVMVSFGYSTQGVESKFGGNTFEANKNRFNFDNAGVVFSSKIGNMTSLKYVNFAFNYSRVKSFNRSMNAAGNLNGASQTFQMAAMSDGITMDMWQNSNPFNNNEIGWLSALGYEGYLIGPSETGGTDFYTSVLADGDYPYMRDFRLRESGGVNQFDFNLSLNFNDRFYLGLTVGAYDVDYNKYTLYDEDFRTSTGESTGAGYSLESFNNVSGAGFDFKLGAIVRPFEDSPFRVGLAIHTPTFYNLTWATSARLISDLYDGDDVVTETIDSYDYLNNGDMKQDYKIRTPWVYNLSLGYTVGTELALGAEYEYKDYSTTKFYDYDGYGMDWQNGESKLCMKGVSTFRLGAEYKVIPQFALRAGYNYSTAAFKDDAIKAMHNFSINTDTDYTNLKSLSNYTLGIGYKGSSFYADLAYKYSVQKGDFYAFDSRESERALSATKLTDTRSQVIVTLGMRF